MARRALIGVGAALVILAVIVGGGLVYAHHSYTSAMKIDTTTGIDEASYVPIGGIDQWIQIRGSNRNNPVLLWLSGGPGDSDIWGTVAFEPWERAFTVVMWDQRGEGKTFVRSGASVADTMSADRMASDGVEVAEYLRTHLRTNKIIVVGLSWGTMLGVRMVHQRPDLFTAYVGVGQVVDMRQGAELGYKMMLARAQDTGNAAALADLKKSGPPPYANLDFIKRARSLEPRPQRPDGLWAAVWAVFHHRLIDRTDRAGFYFSQRILANSMLNEDITAIGTSFDLPMIFFQGSGDMTTPTALTKAYLEKITAPSKALVVIEGAGHAAMNNQHQFLQELQKYVGGLAASG